MNNEDFKITSKGIWLRKATKREKSLENWCDALRDEVNILSVVIIVEGRKDVEALAQLGLTARSAGRFPRELAKQLLRESIKTIILLPDTDKAGEKHLKNWRYQFQKSGLGTIDRYWKVLRSLRISHIEGLPTHIRRSGREHKPSS
ncbi:MAG: toprim domain-containing protein [Candidatus Heimdallarchaeota archaeon]